jgi:hypothetical protein
MTFRVQVLSVLAALLLVTSLALGASAAPAGSPAPATPASPATPATIAAQPLAPSTGAPVCPAAGLPAFLPAPQPAAGALCGPCSDKACAGHAEFFTCGSGLRCLVQGACTATGNSRCECLII